MRNGCARSHDGRVFVENRLQYGMKGPRPNADYLIPLGKARIARPGRDVTVVSYSRMLQEVLAAAEEVAGDGIEAEVIDLRTVAPFDRAAVLESLQRTRRLVIAHEAPTFMGMGAEIAAAISEKCFYHLESPVIRVGGYNLPYPPSRLEEEFLPDLDRVLDGVDRALAY